MYILYEIASFQGFCILLDFPTAFNTTNVQFGNFEIDSSTESPDNAGACAAAADCNFTVTSMFSMLTLFNVILKNYSSKLHVRLLLNIAKGVKL